MSDPAEPWEPLIEQLPEPWPDIARAQIRAESAAPPGRYFTMVPTDTQRGRHDASTKGSSEPNPPQPVDGP